MTTNNPHELVAFAKNVLVYLEAPVNPDNIDWEFLLKQFNFRKQKSTPGLMFINWIVCKYYEVDEISVRYNLKGRKGEERKARQVVFYIATRFFDYGPSEVAGFYYRNNKNMTHSNVLQGANKVETEININDKLRTETEDIIYKLSGYEYRDKITWKGRSTTGIPKNVSGIETNKRNS